MSILSHITSSVKPSGKSLDPAEKLRLERAVREFESVFIGYMLKSMRNTVEKADNSSEGFGADMLEGLFDVELAKHVSKSSNLGLADMLYRKLTGETLPGKKVASVSEKSSATQVNASPQVRDSKVGRPVLGKGIEKEVIAAERAALLQPSRTSAEPVATKVQTARKSQTLGKSLKGRLDEYDQFIAAASAQHGVNKHLIKAVIAAESNAVGHARSPKNAKGLMQLIDSTAAEMGVQNVWDPEQNIMGGAKYLRQLLDLFNGNQQLALASYNAGRGNVAKYGGVPPFKETREYIARVTNFMKLFATEEANDE